MPTFILRLSEPDRERLGAPEDLEADLDWLMLSEARALDKAMGLTPSELLVALGGKPVLDANGEPIPGRILVDNEAWAFVVWLALRRVGIDVPLADLDYDVYALRLITPKVEEDAEAPDPKDPSTRAKRNGAAKLRSTTSSKRTSLPSPTSSASPRTSSKR